MVMVVIIEIKETCLVTWPKQISILVRNPLPGHTEHKNRSKNIKAKNILHRPSKHQSSRKYLQILVGRD